jgi:hypothetical protein
MDEKDSKPIGDPPLENGTLDHYAPPPTRYNGPPMIGEIICWIPQKIQGRVTGHHGTIPKSKRVSGTLLRTRANVHWWWIEIPDIPHNTFIVLKKKSIGQREWRTKTELEKEPEKYFSMYGCYPQKNESAAPVSEESLGDLSFED